jgi:hypothetical protein
VQHVNETSGRHYDSTNNNNDGTVQGDPDQGVVGKIDGADYFDGSGDRIQLPQVFTDENEFTIEAWIYAESGARNFISQWSSSNGAFLQIWNDNLLQFYINGDRVAYSSIAINKWYHVSATYNGSVANLYLDACNPIKGTGYPPSWPFENLYIGDRSTFNRAFHGLIDEIRLSDISRNLSWIKTSYNNMNATNSFYTLGIEEDVNFPHISNEIPIDGSTGLKLNPTLKVKIKDFQNDSIDWWIMINNSNSWEIIDNGIIYDGYGYLSIPTTIFNDYGKTYQWSVNTTDAGSGKWNNKSYVFTTTDKIFLSNPFPENGQTWVSLNPELSITFEDIAGDLISLIFRTNASGTWKDIDRCNNLLNGTYNQTSKWMLHRNTTYFWSVNATDGNGWWTNETYTFSLVVFKGERYQPIGMAYCGKFPDIRPAKEKGKFIALFMEKNGNNWAKYDINKGWTKTYEKVFSSGYAPHCTFGFWDDSYHIFDTHNWNAPNYISIADSPKPNFESYRPHSFRGLDYNIGEYINWTNPLPRTYTFDNNNAWLLIDEWGSDAYIEYIPWNKSSGWSNGIPIGKTTHSSLVLAPCLLRYNRTTWYLYYMWLEDESNPMRYIKSTDSGKTWSNEKNCTDISCATGGYTKITRTSFARYGNNFYIFIRDVNGNAVVFNSTDMENWGNKQVIKDGSWYLVTGNLLHQSALICVASGTSYHDHQYGFILPISEMISNPEKPTNPCPANNTEFPTGKTSTYLNVTVHGNQTYDIAFYWANGTFIGEDKILEEGDQAKIFVTGLKDNTNYEWYAIARGCIDEYIGREPMTMSDEVWTETFTFTIGNP